MPKRSRTRDQEGLPSYGPKIYPVTALLGIIPNLDASVSWWTTVAAARIFWLIFGVLIITIGTLLAFRRRSRSKER